MMHGSRCVVCPSDPDGVTAGDASLGVVLDASWRHLLSEPSKGLVLLMDSVPAWVDASLGLLTSFESEQTAITITTADPSRPCQVRRRCTPFNAKKGVGHTWINIDGVEIACVDTCTRTSRGRVSNPPLSTAYLFFLFPLVRRRPLARTPARNGASSRCSQSTS